MSEYWISQPNFGTMGRKSSATVVHAPRNVDLPVRHVEEHKINRKRKCLCLSVWLIGLLLLTAGAIVVAHFLVPDTFSLSSQNDSYRQVATCSDLSLTLEDKVKHAEIILVGAILPNMSVEVVKMIKGQPLLNWPKLQKSECFEQSAARQVFFLVPERQGRSAENPNEASVFMPKYQALIATAKVVEIVEKLAAEEELGGKRGNLLVAPQPVTPTTKTKTITTTADSALAQGVCLDIEVMECHQIEQCQLVIGPNAECSCQNRGCSMNKSGIGAKNSGPVCGSDHVTYRDSCQLKNAACTKHLNISQIADVPCEDAGLCGQNGCPFHGMCLRDAQLGKYKCHCPECFVEDLNSQVCGNDGVTYLSKCHLQQSSCLQHKPIIFDYDGQCKKCQECPYDSKCYRGQCKCPKVCPHEYEPVCGTDGRTYNNECWMMQQTCNNEKIVQVQSKGKCPHPDHTCLSAESYCQCPHGILAPGCHQCLPGFWAYTSFGCLDCGCSVVGSRKGKCDEFTGQCECLTGFSGDKCQICPDGSEATIDGCLSRSTKYAEPIKCGDDLCDFGAICSQGKCECQIECSENPEYYQEPVCGDDGNTYRSECQLRQNSCRMQKEVIIAKYTPCHDAPLYMYGNDSRQVDILSDSTGAISFYGLIGDKCVDERDCLIDSTTCIDGVCACVPGFRALENNFTCTEYDKSMCDPNPCQGGGTCEEHDGTFSCYCPIGLAGSYCQHDVSKASIQVASFTGDSLLGVVTPDDHINRFNIELNFRTFADNGIIFYSQGSLTSDFLSLAILDGHVEFRYDLGGGPVVIKSNTKVVMGQWHQLVAKRYNQDGYLALDEFDIVRGQTSGSIKTLNVGQLSWIGGVNDDIKTTALKKAGTSSGFMGCMKDVQIGRFPISIHSEHEPKIMQRKNLIECSDNPCSRSPCSNGGSCEADGRQGFRCNCKPGFTGRQCHKPRDPCHPNPCQNHGVCRLDDLRGFLCSCNKPGSSGRLCEITDDSSNEDMRYRKSLENDGKEKVQFSLKTNLTQESGKLFSIKLDGVEDESLDFGLTSNQELWIEYLKQRLVEPALISSNEWHKVVVTRQHQRLSLKVDHHHELLHLDESWPVKISFSEEPIAFTDLAQGQLCLRNFHIIKWNHGRKSKTLPIDICR